MVSHLSKHCLAYQSLLYTSALRSLYIHVRRTPISRWWCINKGLSVGPCSDNSVTFQSLTHTLNYFRVYQIASVLNTMYFLAYICFLFNQVSCGLKRMPPHLRFTHSTLHCHPCGTYCTLILQRDNAIFS